MDKTAKYYNALASLVTDSDKIILSTYHSSKGLDFDKVFMPFCNVGAGNEDDARLFMVAMSRSRKRFGVIIYNLYESFHC